MLIGEGLWTIVVRNFIHPDQCNRIVFALMSSANGVVVSFSVG
jgi:hypothetical protein